jgi:high frequency lysogenization protein
MTTENEIDRSTALSALVQAANLVDRLASHGQIPQSSFDVMRASLFSFDAENAGDIYQMKSDDEINPLAKQTLSQNLSTGIRVCKKVFQEGASREYPHTIRYVMGIIQLEKHFRNSSKLQDLVKNRLQSLETTEKEQLNGAISALYLDSLATLPFRIQVLGKMQHLQNTENEHQVRVLLFAGIRAAMLWHQYGGRRWHFLLMKNSINRGLDAIQ